MTAAFTPCINLWLAGDYIQPLPSNETGGGAGRQFRGVAKLCPDEDLTMYPWAPCTEPQMGDLLQHPSRGNSKLARTIMPHHMLARVSAHLRLDAYADDLHHGRLALQRA